MGLDRSWVRRPLVSPPPFGESLPSVWKESEVAFLRARPITKTHGGFSAGNAPAVNYLRCRAHVQLENEPAGPYDLNSGVVQRRLLRVFLDYPVQGDRDVLDWDGSTLPTKGDKVIWTDPLGIIYTVDARVVLDPLNMHDHIEVETELFE